MALIMANHGTTSLSETHCVFVETSLNTFLTLLVYNNESVSEFKEKLCKEHQECFPEIGQIHILALKVKRRSQFYHLSDKMIVSKAFDGISKKNWFMYVDAIRAENDEQKLTLYLGNGDKTVDQEKDVAAENIDYSVYERGEGSRLALCAADNLLTDELVTLPENQLVASSGLRTGLDTEKKRKRGSRTDPATQKRKRTKSSKIETHGSPFAKATHEGNEMGEKIDVESRKNIPNAADSVSCQENQLEASSCLISLPSTENKRERTKISTSETHGNPFAEPRQIENQNEKEEKIDVQTDNIQTGNFVSCPEKQLESSSGLIICPATEKKKTRKKSSTVKISRSKAVATRNVDCVNAISEPCPIARTGNLDNLFVEERQRENEIGKKIDVDVGNRESIPDAADNNQTGNFVICLENQLEKKKMRKKSSKNRISRSKTVATTTSRDNLNEITRVHGNVDRVDAISEPCPTTRTANLDNPFAEPRQKDNETGDKIKVQTDNFVNCKENQLEVSSGAISCPNTEKKKTLEKSSKDRTSRSKAVFTTALNEITGVPENVDHVDAVSKSCPISIIENLDNHLAEASQKENEKIDVDVGNREAIPNAEDNNQTDVSVICPESQLEAKTTGPAKENKRKQNKHSEKRSTKKQSLNIVESVDEINNSAEMETLPINNAEDNYASLTKAKDDTDESNNTSHLKVNANMGDNIVGSSNKLFEKEKKSLETYGSLKLKDISGSKVKKLPDASKKGSANNKKEVVNKSSNSLTVDKRKNSLNFFKDAENWSSTEDEDKSISDPCTETTWDHSSEYDSDSTFMPLNQEGNNLVGVTDRVLGKTLQDVVKSSKSYKEAKVRASQSLADDIFDDEDN